MLGVSNNDRCSAQCIRPIINGWVKINSKITKNHKNYSALKMCTENIFSYAKGNTPQLDLLLKSELMKLFWMLENSGDIFELEKPKNNRSDIIRPALEYINKNFHENITVEQLADTVHLSRSYFMNCFRQVAGVGAIEYITHLRIKAASELLINSSKTITEIAFQCGFRNISNFNRQFKKIVGCAPSYYRKTL